MASGAFLSSGYGGASTVCCNIDEDLDGVRVTETIMWNLHDQEVRARVSAVLQKLCVYVIHPLSVRSSHEQSSFARNADFTPPPPQEWVPLKLTFAHK